MNDTKPTSGKMLVAEFHVKLRSALRKETGGVLRERYLICIDAVSLLFVVAQKLSIQALPQFILYAVRKQRKKFVLMRY